MARTMADWDDDNKPAKLSPTLASPTGNLLIPQALSAGARTDSALNNFNDARILEGAEAPHAPSAIVGPNLSPPQGPSATPGKHEAVSAAPSIPGFRALAFDPAGSLINLLQGETEAAAQVVEGSRFAAEPGRRKQRLAAQRLEVETGLGRPRRHAPISAPQWGFIPKPSGPHRLALGAAVGGSLLIGYNIAVLNSTLRYINWEFGWCEKITPRTATSTEHRMSSIEGLRPVALDRDATGVVDLNPQGTGEGISMLIGPDQGQHDVAPYREGHSAEAGERILSGFVEPLSEAPVALMPDFWLQLDPEEQSKLNLNSLFALTDVGQQKDLPDDDTRDINRRQVAFRGIQNQEVVGGFEIEMPPNNNTLPGAEFLRLSDAATSRVPPEPALPLKDPKSEELGSGSKPYNAYRVSSDPSSHRRQLQSLNLRDPCRGGLLFEALANSLLYAGGMVGASSCVRLLRQGRRRTLQLGICITLTGMITQVCSTWIAGLAWGRFLSGCGIGILSVVVPTYLSEISPPPKRGYFGAFHQLFVMAGLFLAPALSLPPMFVDRLPDNFWLLARHPTLFSKIWWRLCILLPIIPATISLILFSTKFPWETAHWALLNDRIWEAKAITQYVYHRVEVVPQLEQILDEVELSKDAKEAGNTLWNACRHHPGLRSVIFLGPVLLSLQQLGGISVMFSLSSDIFLHTGLRTPWPQLVTAIGMLMPLLVTFGAIWLLDRVGRKKLFLYSVFGELVCLIPATITTWIRDEKELSVTVTTIVACFGYIICYSFGHGPVLWVYLFEVYPLEIKAACQSLAVSCNWLFGVVTVFAGHFAPGKIKFLMYSAFAVLNLIVGSVWLRETKGRQLLNSPFMEVAARHELAGW